MYRNKPPLDSGFRAPQLSLGRVPDAWPGAELATPNETPSEGSASLGETRSGAPIVIVRRKRRIELPAAVQPQTQSAETHSRVFTLKQKDCSDPPSGSLSDSAVATTLPGSPSVELPIVELGADLQSARANQTVFRRRRVPDHKRPSATIVTRPSIAQQLEAVEAAATARDDEPSASPFKLDLYINARWTYVDKALNALRETLPVKKMSGKRFAKV